MNLVNGRAAVFDLSSGESSEVELSDEQFMSRPSIVLASELAKENGGDALVLGSGLLTGSLLPAAGAGFAWANGRVAPLLGLAGVELKLTGFDLLVIKGKAPEPGYLWARDGMVELVPAPDMKGSDSWSRTDGIRDAQGDRKIQVLACGPWGDSEHPCSQLVVNYWGGEDKHGLAREFGRRGLVAVAFRGMGELALEDPDGHLEAAIELRRKHLTSFGSNKGLVSYAASPAPTGLDQLVHRHVACFGCPFPCRSFAKVDEPPSQMALGSREPGYLHYDLSALEAAAARGYGVREATAAMMRCARAGAEPVAVFAASAPEDVDGLLSSMPALQPAPSPLKGSFESSFPDEQTYVKCLGLGLCPRYWAKAGFDMPSISACATPALGTALRI